MRIIAIIISLIIFYKGVQKNNNLLFWLGICGMVGFLMWEIFDAWVAVGTGLMQGGGYYTVS